MSGFPSGIRGTDHDLGVFAVCPERPTARAATTMDVMIRVRMSTLSLVSRGHS
jgi:hypothetical protein